MLSSFIAPHSRHGLGLFRSAALALVWVTAGACDTTPGIDESATNAPRIVALGPHSTRALQVMSLSEAIVAADSASRLLLDRADVHLAQDPIGARELALWKPTLFVSDRVLSEEAPLRAELAHAGVPLLELSPHDLDDARALYRSLADLVEDEARGDDVVRRLDEALVTRAARHLGRLRPCVAVVTQLRPFVLAGGHSFETDVIQILGAESATHPNEDWRSHRSIEGLEALALDLLLVLDTSGATEADLEPLRVRLAPTRVQTVRFDSEALWLDDPAERRAIFDRWEALIVSARETSRSHENCGLDPAARSAMPPTRSD